MKSLNGLIIILIGLVLGIEILTVGPHGSWAGERGVGVGMAVAGIIVLTGITVLAWPRKKDA